MSVITRKLPAMDKVESVVKLANGKAAEVSRLSSKPRYSYRVRWLLRVLDVLLPNFKGARVGDNVVFEREHGNSFDSSCLKVGLSQDSCVYYFGHLEAIVASIINLLWSRLENPGQV